MEAWLRLLFESPLTLATVVAVALTLTQLFRLGAKKPAPATEAPPEG